MLLILLLVFASLSLGQTQFNIVAVTNQGQFVNANLNLGNCRVDFTSSPPAFRCSAPLPTSSILGGIFASDCTIGKVVNGVGLDGRLKCTDAVVDLKSPKLNNRLTHEQDSSFTLSSDIDSTGQWIVLRNGLDQTHGEDYIFDSTNPRRIIPIWKKVDGSVVQLVGEFCTSDPEKLRCWNSDGRDIIKAHLYY